ncbi:truncated transcription factor CAULIFLOWER A-like [Neltuma alba]|uniref:truncated transcription factor CAULIFLOWER A-like n=1 Tax=Neltuma alba TaxID=207710 RepID=UPI0010A46B77|nr:truncated transcription factor CAULIFLOWER A-like [Prosopis alba]
MGRGRVQLKRIENSSTRHVTFSKRKGGLLKKANEISVLCDAQVALILFSCRGKLTEFNSPSSSMDSILERYERCSHSEQLAGSNNDSQGNLSLELFKLTTRAEVLQKNIRNYEGEDLDPLSLKELQSLEHQLENALKRIRTKKNQIMIESISEKHRKEKALKDENNMLAKKLKEKEKSLTNGVGPRSRQQTLRQCPFNFNVSPPQLPPPPPPPTLTLGGACGEGGAMLQGDDDAEAEAEAGPNNSVVMPPWMMFHHMPSSYI